MNNIKSAVLFAASVTGLTLSAVSFAAGSTAYNDAVTAAKSDYKTAVATCKDKSPGERGSCMKEANAEQKLAMDKARGLRGMNKEPRDKPVDKNAPAAADAPAGKSVDPAK